jgi:type IV pilus assembly protein PilM
MKLNQEIKLPNISFDFLNKLKFKGKRIKFPKEYIAVDLGSFALKAVEFNLKDRTIEKVFYYPWDTALKSTQIIEIIKSSSFISELGSLLLNNGFRSKNILVQASNYNLVMRPMSLPPNIPEYEIGHVLRTSLEDEIPYTIDEVYYDFAIEDRSKKETLINVYAAQKDYIDAVIDMFNKLRYEVYQIGVPSNLVWNTIKYNYLEDDDLDDSDLFVSIDIGYNTTIITIFSSDKVFLYRTLSYGGAHFTRAIEKDYNLSELQAEHFKCQKGIEKVNDNENLLQIQQEIFNQIWRSIQYVISRNRMYILKGIYLSGGSANLKGFDMKLKRYLEIQNINMSQSVNIRIVDPFKYIDLVDGIDESEFKHISSTFTNVIGLALGGTEDENY